VNQIVLLDCCRGAALSKGIIQLDSERGRKMIASGNTGKHVYKSSATTEEGKLAEAAALQVRPTRMLPCKTKHFSLSTTGPV
jgi:hypothetical protein